MKAFCAISLVLLMGCSGRVSIRSEGALPDTKEGLIEYIAEKEAEVSGLELELEEVKRSRDAMAETAKNAEGWFAKDTTSTKLSRANHYVEFAASDLTYARRQLAKAKAKLESITTN